MIESIMWALAGAVAASMLAWIPALHIYNVAALLLLIAESGAVSIEAESLAFLFLGLVSGYAMGNTIPSIFFAAPDESMIFVVLPGQKYLLQGRGFEAVALTGLGGVVGLSVLVALAPVASRTLPALREILQPHLGWILWTIIAYLLLSEWPKGTGRAPTGWQRWWDGWRSLLAGLATFTLSGLLGMILMHRSPVRVDVAFQNLMPAFVGLFAVPWIVTNLLGRVSVPRQTIARSLDIAWGDVVQGATSGVLGGLFAAFLPVVTGGIGGFVAGHATAQRDDRAFLVAQGAAKIVYYVGGLLLFFVPGLHLTRGGMAWMVSTRYTPYTPAQYYAATAGALAAGVLAFLMSLWTARLAAAVVSRIPYRILSCATLAILMLVVGGVTGPVGLAICAVATGIGLIPVFWGARRMNAMGVLLLPIALNMSGTGHAVAGFLGLLN